VDRLRYWVEHLPEQTAYSFLSNGDDISESWTFVELDRRARAIAAELQQRGLQGERALLLYPPGLDFIAGFFGCLYAGVIAVPAFPPRRNRNMGRIQSIADDATAAVALTVEDVRQRTTWLLENNSPLRALQGGSTNLIAPPRRTPGHRHSSLSTISPSCSTRQAQQARPRVSCCLTTT